MSRPSSRQSTRSSAVDPACRELLVSLGLLPGSLSQHEQRQLISKTGRQLDSGGGLRNEWTDVHHTLHQLVRKYRIISPADRLADALELETDKLDLAWHASTPGDDRDAQIKMENLPAHVAFLIALSNKADESTRLAASNLVRSAETRPKTDREIYKEIMAAEDDADGSDNDSWVEPDYGSHASEDDQDSDPASYSDDGFTTESGAATQPTPRDHPPLDPASSLHLPPMHLAFARRAPPRPWQDPRLFFDQDPIDYSNVYGWRHLLKMPSLPRFLDVCENDRAGVSLPDHRRYIYETDCVREVLLALTGRPGVMFEIGSDAVTVMDNVHLLHYSPTAAASLLGEITDGCTTLLHLGKFCEVTFNYETMEDEMRAERIRQHATVVQFAGAVQHFLREFHLWLADREQELILALAGRMEPGKKPLVATVAAFAHHLKRFLPSFTLLEDIIDNLPSLPTTMPPSKLANGLLDTLYRCVSCHHSIGEYQIATDLERILLHTSEPMWVSVGRWLHHGIQTDEAHTHGGKLSPEFFIQREPVSVARTGDSHYWTDGYSLRHQDDAEEGRPGLFAVPAIFGDLGPGLLSAGKAVGLLRQLGVSAVFAEAGEDEWPGVGCNPAKWASIACAVGTEDSFPDLFPANKVWDPPPTSIHLFALKPRWTPPPPPPARLPKPPSHTSDPPAQPPALPSTVDFPRALSDYLSPLIRLLQYKLHRVIVDDCGLLAHLDAIEGLFLMRRGECLGDWTDKIWRKMDSNQPWKDSIVLASSFEDAHDAELERWIDPSRVRFPAQRGGPGSKGSASRRVKALQSLSVVYLVPRPLDFVFTDETMATRSRIFVLLLQLRRARSVLTGLTLIKREEWQTVKDGQETKAFYALRRRLSWVMQVLWDFVMTSVVQVQTTRFRKELEKTASLDDMIPLHQYHIDRLEELCLLSKRTATLHKAVVNILDLCVLFSDVFAAFTTDAALAAGDLSTQSVLPPRFSSTSTSTARAKTKSDARRKRSRRKDEEDDLAELEAALREEVEHAPESEDEANSASTRRGSANRTAGTYGAAGQTTVMSVSFADESFLSRIERMSTELGSLVHFLQLGVDTLAKTSVSPSAALDSESTRTLRWTREMGDVRETWEILAWQLEAYI